MTTEEETDILDEIAFGLTSGTVIPYLGPGIFHAGADFPVNHQALVTWFSAKVSLPGRLRDNLSASAQYIENFKHRKTLIRLLEDAFRMSDTPTIVHRFLAALPDIPLIVDTWYDGTMAKALETRGNRKPAFAQINGISPADFPGEWFRHSGDLPPEEAKTVLYKPYGSVYPDPQFVISDSDYVEILTEIDIQTPIPPVVQQLRTGRHFLFLGCRFNHQLARIFGQSIMKRSSDRHWAVIAEEPTPNEIRFMERQNIVPVKIDLDPFIQGLGERTAHVAGTLPEAGCKSA